MRVPTTTYTEAFTNDLNTLRARQSALQNQATTGLRVNSASDDPAAMQNALTFLADKSATHQHSANIAALQDRTTQIYSALQSLQKISSHAGEIAVAAVDDTTPDKKAALLSDLNAMIKQAVVDANTKNPLTGAGLFGGTSGSASPFTATTDSSGNVTAVGYTGNAAVNAVETGKGATVSVDVPGMNNSGTGARGLFTDSRSGADFFANLIKLRDDIATGNSTAVHTTDTAALQKDSDNLIFHIGNLGAQQTRLDLSATTLQNRMSALDKNISDATSADLVQTIVQLNQAQNSYQAALQSGSKIMQLSILNYIQ